MCESVNDARIVVYVGATFPTAPSVRIAKSRQFSMAQWTKRKRPLVADAFRVGLGPLMVNESVRMTKNY